MTRPTRLQIRSAMNAALIEKNRPPEADRYPKMWALCTSQVIPRIGMTLGTQTFREVVARHELRRSLVAAERVRAASLTAALGSRVAESTQALSAALDRRAEAALTQAAVERKRRRNGLRRGRA